MNTLILGGSGQLGFELQRAAPAGLSVTALTRPAIDFTNLDELEAKLTEYSPGLIINAAAYTAVDKAEQELELAESVNSLAVKQVAKYCSDHGARLIHVSTDFVFDGNTAEPYSVDAETSPIGVYGASKRAGELALIESEADFSIVRTSWVYSSHGNNFVKTMLRLMAEKTELGVVSDQVGTPTYAAGLASACWNLALSSEADDLYHYSDAGQCSWYEFAVEIQRQAFELGLLEKKIPINPITTEQYPTPAKRPKYSVLEKSRIIEFGCDVQQWKVQLNKMLKELV